MDCQTINIPFQIDKRRITVPITKDISQIISLTYLKGNTQNWHQNLRILLKSCHVSERPAQHAIWRLDGLLV